MSSGEVQKHKTRKRFEGRKHARELNVACFQNGEFLRSERACVWFCASLMMALAKHSTRLWAFCIMPNHVHLLVCPESLEWQAGPFLQTLKQSVTRKALLWTRANAPSKLGVMRDEQPSGRVFYRFWQRGGGFDRNLWQDETIWNMIEYIHMNPVEAGLCARPEAWRWSSAAAHARRGESPVELDLQGLPPQPA